jgi:hypothetical protein
VWFERDGPRLAPLFFLYPTAIVDITNLPPDSVVARRPNIRAHVTIPWARQIIDANPRVVRCMKTVKTHRFGAGIKQVLNCIQREFITAQAAERPIAAEFTRCLGENAPEACRWVSCGCDGFALRAFSPLKA